MSFKKTLPDFFSRPNSYEKAFPAAATPPPVAVALPQGLAQQAPPLPVQVLAAPQVQAASPQVGLPQGLAQQRVPQPQQQRGFGDLLGQMGQQQPAQSRAMFAGQAPERPIASSKQSYEPPPTRFGPDPGFTNPNARLPGGGAGTGLFDGENYADTHVPVTPDSVRVNSQIARARDDHFYKTELPARMSAIDQEIQRLRDQQNALASPIPYDAYSLQGVYDPATHTTTWTSPANGQVVHSMEGNYQGAPPPELPAGFSDVEIQRQSAALSAQIQELESQRQVFQDRMDIAEGNTYQGRAGGFTDGVLGTAFNALDTGRETVVTEYGDAIANWIETGDQGFLLRLTNQVGLQHDDMLPPELAAMKPGDLQNEMENGPQAGQWMYSWINEDESRKKQALQVFYQGYDADGDGMIDFTGGRAVWEWYIGQQPWYTSLVSQILLDPLNLTVAAGSIGGWAGGMAGVAALNGNLRAAGIWNGVATGLTWASRIDDPLWWFQGGLLGGASRIGRKTGRIKTANGELITEAERRAHLVKSSTTGDNSGLFSMLATPVDQIPVHNPTVVNGQQVQQVGNSGVTFIASSPDGSGYVVMARGQNNKFTVVGELGQTYATQAEAVQVAREQEALYVATRYAHGDDASARMLDSRVPIVYGDGVAHIGYGGEVMVSADPATGKIKVSIQGPDGQYLDTGQLFDTPEEAVNAGLDNYLGTTGSQTTTGGVTTPGRVSVPAGSRGSFVPNPRRGGAELTPFPEGPSRPIGPGAAQPSGAAPGPATGGSMDIGPIVPTPDDTVLLAPTAGASSADVVRGSTVNRGDLSYTYEGTVPVDDYQSATWSVTTPGGQIYEVVSDADGNLDVIYTGMRRLPDGTEETVTGPVYVAQGVQPTLDDTASIISDDRNMRFGAVGGDAQPPTGSGVVPTGGAADVGPVTPSPDPSITPPRDPDGGPIGEVSGDGIPAQPGTGAAVDVGEVTRTGDGLVDNAAPQIEGAGPNVEKEFTGRTRPPRDPDAPVSLADDAGPGPRGGSAGDTPAVPSSVLGPVPDGARPGIYYRTISSAAGDSAVDLPPHEIWLANASTAVRLPNADEILGNWAAQNPRIQASRAVFDDALRTGDEIDQALASMELQATLMEEWAATGARAEYGGVGAVVSPGASGANAKDAAFGAGEWAKNGRGIERVASGSPRGYDLDNLRRTGFLPGGEHELASALREGRFPRYTASTDGRAYIVPDGSNRLFADQFAAMSPQQREGLIQNLFDRNFRAKAHENQRRIDDIQSRMRAAQTNSPRRDPITPPASSAPAQKPDAPEIPGADTRTKKANAQAMTPMQEAIIPGERFAGWDAYRRENGLIDIEPFREGLSPFGQFIDLTGFKGDDLGWELFFRNADRTKRYDITEIRVGSKDYRWGLIDQDGKIWGLSKNKRELMQKLGDVEVGEGMFLRVFDGKTGRLAVAAKGARRPSKLAAELVNKYGESGVLQVVEDQDGLFHLVARNNQGVRLAVFNHYDTPGAAIEDAINVRRTGRANGWEIRDPDNKPITITGRGEGGATFATVPGVPQLADNLSNVGRRYSEMLGYRRSTPAVVPSPKDDGTFAGRLFDDGAIDDDIYDVLSSRYNILDKDGKVVREGILVQDEVLDRMIKYGNFNRAFNEVVDEWEAFKKPVIKGRGAAAKVITTVNQNARANALYGIHRVWAGMSGDAIGNAVTSMLSGYGPTQFVGIRDGRQFWKALRSGNWDNVDDSASLFVQARKNGVVLRSDDIGDVTRWDVPMKGDMPASQVMQAVGVPPRLANAISSIPQNRLARDGRNWQDAIDRNGLSITEYWRQLFDSRVRMVKVVRDEASRLGENPALWHQKFVDLGTDVNVDLLRDAFGNNRIINRAWVAETKNIRDGVLGAVRKYKFVGGRTNIDEALSNLVFFHYWNSRALALHAEIAAKNPILLNLYLSAYEDSMEQVEELGLPDWFMGFMKFMGGPEGWMGFTNVVGQVIPFFMFAEIGGDNWGEGGFLPTILSLGAFSPWLLGALTVAGYGITRMPDLTYSTGTRNMIRATINWMRANGYGPVDQFLSPVGDPVDDFQDRLLNWLNKHIGVEFLGGSEIEETDPRASDLRLLNLMLDQKMDELYGPDWRVDPALMQASLEGKAAFVSGQGHTPVSEQVYKDWANGKFEQIGLRVLLPGQAQFSYGPQNANWAKVQAIYQKLDRGGTLTAEEQELLNANSANSQTPDARNLNAQMDEYYDIGTKFQRDLNKVRSQLLYEDAPEGTWVIINQNENYSAEEWNAMSVDERRDSVWRWVAAQGGTDQLNLYYQARDSYLASHPDLRGYVQWRESFRSDPEVIHAEMMRMSPSYREYINGLRNPDDQSKWMSIEAYYNSIGENYMLTDNVDDNPLNPNPLNAITGYLQTPAEGEGYQPEGTGGSADEEDGYGSGNWRTLTEFQQNAPAEFIEYQQQQYDEQVSSAQPIVDDVLEEGGWSWMAGMTFAEIEATAQQKGTSKAYDQALQAIKNELYRLNVKVPSKNGEVRDYERWRDQRLAADPNADVSLQAFERELLADQERYGIGQFAPNPVQQQEDYNAQMAAWWNANPNASFFGQSPHGKKEYADYMPAPERWRPGR